MKFYLNINLKDNELVEVEAETKEEAWQKLYCMVKMSKPFIRENTVSEEEAHYNSYE